MQQIVALFIFALALFIIGFITYRNFKDDFKRDFKNLFFGKTMRQNMS